jgi:hypothetical protein
MEEIIIDAGIPEQCIEGRYYFDEGGGVFGLLTR